MMERTDTPSSGTAPDLQWLLAQGVPPQQIMAMLQQNSQLANKQQNHLTSFVAAPPVSPAANTPDSSAFFSNLDAGAAAKQMAALNAAGIARRASQTGGTSGAFLGGIPSNQPGQNINAFRPASSAGHVSTSPGPNQALPQHVSSSLGIPASTSMQFQPPGDPSFLQRYPMMPPQAPPTSQSYTGRQQSFLNGLATIMAARNTPLPPSVTGVPCAYDPATSPWKNLEPASALGGFKLAGQDVDLFKLWGLVFQNGGAGKLQQQALWGNVLSHFHLPERLPHPQPNGNMYTAQALSSYYMALLAPFEEAYIKNLHDQQRKIALARQQQMGSGSGQGSHSQQSGAPSPSHSGFPGQTGQVPTLGSGIPSNTHTPQQFPGPGSGGIGQYSSPVMPQTPQQQRATANMMGGMQAQSRRTMSPTSSLGSLEQLSTNQASVRAESLGQPFTPGNTDFDSESEGRKRKQTEETDAKRARRKTDSEPPPTTPSRGPGSERMSQPPLSTTPSAPTSVAPGPRVQPSRRKIEYVPLAREVETAGGRDISSIEAELARVTHGQNLRHINDWGLVDIESLTMSIRSRISTELSYALTTITLLSTMLGNSPTTGFPIHQCPDLIDEVLDLLEEMAFDGTEDIDDPVTAGQTHITTQRELVNIIQEEGMNTFGCLKKCQGMQDPDRGPMQRPGDVVRIVTNMIRNLSVVPDNQPYMAQHPVLLDLVLRVASLAPPAPDAPRAASASLSLSDLVIVRKDALNILGNLAGMIHLAASSTPSAAEVRKTKRAYELITSYIVDPAEALTPIAWLLQTGVPFNAGVRPPSMPDTALEVFTRISQPDTNRQVFSRIISKEWMWCFFEALVHRLPVVDHDYQIVMRDTWLSYVEKTVMAIYSLAFLMPPDMKKRVKTDRSLSFAKIMLRMIKKFTLHPSPEFRDYFHVCARRAIEAMKLVDDGDDSFDTSQPNMPQLSFGMGYGEMGDKRVEKGTGMLGGHQEEVTWGIMLRGSLDDVMFSELESLARVDFS